MKNSIRIAVVCAVVLAACGRQPLVTKQTNTATDKVREYSTVKADKNPTDPVHGKEVGFWYGAIAGVEGVNANGVGFIHSFEDGAFSVTVNLNIKEAPAKSFHVAWVTDEVGAKTVLVGVVSSIVGDVRHSASLTTKDDLQGLTKVIITLESSEKPEKPSQTREASGFLKELQR